MQFRQDKSVYGAMDLAGSVAEWTDSIFGKAHIKVYRGGSYLDGFIRSRCASRMGLDAQQSDRRIGFRICASITR